MTIMCEGMVTNYATNYLAPKWSQAFDANNLDVIRGRLVLVALEANELHLDLLSLVQGLGHLAQAISIELANLLQQIIEEKVTTFEHTQCRERFVGQIHGNIARQTFDTWTNQLLLFMFWAIAPQTNLPILYKAAGDEYIL